MLNLISAANTWLACLASVAFVYQAQALENKKGGGALQKQPSARGNLKLLIIQSNLPVQPGYIFHHQSPFIICGNHVKSEALKSTYTQTGIWWPRSIPGGAPWVLMMNCPPTPECCVCAQVTGVTFEGGSQAFSSRRQADSGGILLHHTIDHKSARYCEMPWGIIKY